MILSLLLGCLGAPQVSAAISLCLDPQVLCLCYVPQPCLPALECWVTSSHISVYCYAATLLGSRAVLCCLPPRACVSWLHEFIPCYVIFFGCHGTVTHGCTAACDWHGTVDCCYPTAFCYLQRGFSRPREGVWLGPAALIFLSSGLFVG